MDSSIDLSQPEYVNVGKRPSPKELNTSSSFNKIDLPNLRRSVYNVPIQHPYQWKPQKPMNPIKNNSLARISENVNIKVNIIK
jgi:hypothetical protein